MPEAAIADKGRTHTHKHDFLSHSIVWRGVLHGRLNDDNDNVKKTIGIRDYRKKHIDKEPVMK